MAPVLEAVRLLTQEGAAPASIQRRRPADVLLCRAQDIRTGAGGNSGAARVALDVGVVCPQAAGHLQEAAGRVLGAAEAYVVEKCGRGDTERRCREEGIVFQPMIFESMGGIASETEAVIKSLNRSVANNTNESCSLVARRFWKRLSVDIQRAEHRAWVRRAGEQGWDCSSGIDWVAHGADVLRQPVF